MNITEKVDYNMGCKYILNCDDRCRYVNNRQLLFRLYHSLYEYFDTDYDDE
jgi:hypothetical protein